MKSIINFIKEGLKIGSKSKVNTQGTRDLSDTEINNKGTGAFERGALLPELYYKTPSEKIKDHIKAKMYFDKKSKPQTLVNSIKTKDKLIRRWYIYVTLGWEDAYQTFRDEIDKREYYTVDELDKFVLLRYNYLKNHRGLENTIQSMEKYLDTNNVKY